MVLFIATRSFLSIYGRQQRTNVGTGRITYPNCPRQGSPIGFSLLDKFMDMFSDLVLSPNLYITHNID